MGGEKVKQNAVVGGGQGSPPRGRGKDVNDFFQSSLIGITPAWAGKSGVLQADPPGTADHPRVGGEKKSQESHIGAVLGSPPRGRGKD